MTRAGLVAVALAGGVALAPGAASAQSLISVTAPVSVTVPGTVVSSQTCINGTCKTLQGISDLTVTAVVTVNGLTAPIITPALPKGCTGIKAGATITPAGLGSLSVDVTISYVDSTGTTQTISEPVNLALGGPPLTITECASAS